MSSEAEAAKAVKDAYIRGLREAVEIAENAVDSSNYSSHYHCAAMIIRDAILAKVREIEL